MNPHIATLAGGCFWCLESAFNRLSGVEEAVSGYMGGAIDHPTYQQVCGGDSGHAEVVRVRFDPDRIGYRDLLEIFFVMHDPTTLDRQGNDVGSQYRSAIFLHDPSQKAEAENLIAELTALKAFDRPIVTQVTEATTFWPAEDYHQRYYEQFHPHFVQDIWLNLQKTLFLQQQNIHQFLVDGMVVVALPQVISQHPHGVLKSQRHAGVKVGFHLRHGDIKRLAPHHLRENARDDHLAHHPGLRQQVAVGGLLLQRHQFHLSQPGKPVQAGNLEGNSRRHPPTGGFNDGNGGCKLLQEEHHGINHARIGRFGVVALLHPQVVEDSHQVWLEEDPPPAQPSRKTNLSIQLLQAFKNRCPDSPHICPVIVPWRAVLARQANIIPHIVYLGSMGNHHNAAV